MLHHLIAPRSEDEDTRRREFIVNVLIVSIECIFAISVLVSIIAARMHPETYANDSVSILILLALFSFSVFLHVLSRRGFIRCASYMLLGALFLFASYLGYRWGMDVHAGIFLYVLVVIMAGILINSRAAFLAVLLVCAAVFGIGTFQQQGVILTNREWASDMWGATDLTMIALLFLIIATVSWLSNREIEKSLIRARRSETALKEERDQLEVRVQERTEELRKAELERMSQAYRFVEFGRLAGSIFHDLASPLTALSLNLESIGTRAGDTANLARMVDDVARAKSATAHMQKLMSSMKKHLAREGTDEQFSMHNALVEAVHVLGSYARARNVTLRYDHMTEIELQGDPVAFMQILTNIVSNAIESFSPDTASRGNRSVTIDVRRERGAVEIIITDTGPGISPENLEHIFEPFFSTKTESGGLGIGLSLAKRVLEKNFSGTLSASSVLGEGTTFTLYFPVREP